MKRILALSACGLSLAACSGSMPSFEMPGMPSFGMGSGAQTVQFESQPPGAEAKLSTGQACRTPCTMEISASEFTVAFALMGHRPQTVPVRMSGSDQGVDPNTGQPPAPRLVPNPVYVELQPATAPAPPRQRTTPTQSKPVASAATTRTVAAVPAPLAPAPASAQAWSPPSR